jgi:hypothetical protein
LFASSSTVSSLDFLRNGPSNKPGRPRDRNTGDLRVHALDQGEIGMK